MIPRAALAVLIAALCAAPFVLSPYRVLLLDHVALAALIAVGLSLLTGIGGMTSFAQAAYAGLGAYAAAIGALSLDWPPAVTLAAALAASFAVSFAGALITVRLKGHYLPLATIAFAVAAYFVMGGLSITGGYNGLSNVPQLRLGGLLLTDGPAFHALVWTLLIGFILALRNLLDSRPGRAIRALRGGIVAAEAMGIDTARVRLWIFVIACVAASFSGWLYAHVQRFVNPSPFGLNQGIEYLFMTVIGGAASLWGAVAGAGLVLLARQWLQDVLPSLLGAQGNFEIVVFGLAMIAVLQFAPDGLMPAVTKALGLRSLPREAGGAPALPRRSFAAAGTELFSVASLSKRFGGLTANRDLSLTLRAGEIVALIGPNGAGKSTFFDCVSGVTRPDGGTVVLSKQSLTGAPSRRVAAAGLSRTFQHVRLLADMCVIDNVALGAHLRAGGGMLRAALRLDGAEEARLMATARDALTRCGLAARAMALAGSLPLGEQRLVEIARALAADPCILLLDEPAAGLRHVEKRVLAALLKQLRAEGMAILLVEHDMDFVMGLADRITVMEFGEIIAQGAPADIVRDARVREAYLGFEEGGVEDAA